MKLINSELLNSVSAKAKESMRLRMNYNFHENSESKSQRLLNALEIGTELPIHRHRHTAETYVLLRGKIKVLFYNDNGELTETTLLDPLEGNYGIDIPAGQFHTIEILENDSVIFEVKDGPYTPLEEQDMMK